MVGVAMGRRQVYRSRRIVVDFDIDRPGMRKIAKGKELRLAVGTLAAKAKTYAESIAPERTGNYRRSFQVNMTRITIAGMRRVAARLVNTDPAAAAIEWGNQRNPTGHRTLGRTLAHLHGLPEPRGTLNTPTLRIGGALRAIPTLDDFRAQQRLLRAHNRRRSSR